MNNYIIKVYKIIWVVIINLGDHNYFGFVYLGCTNVQNNLGFTKSIFGGIYKCNIFKQKNSKLLLIIIYYASQYSEYFANFKKLLVDVIFRNIKIFIINKKF
jgi:hypothetical protein